MKDLAEVKYVKLVNEIKHQGIGGKDFMIEKEGTVSLLLDTSFNNMTIAMFNFIKRRIDLINGDENIKIYYGHSLETGLGYFIADDEILEIYV